MESVETAITDPIELEPSPAEGPFLPPIGFREHRPLLSSREEYEELFQQRAAIENVELLEARGLLAELRDRAPETIPSLSESISVSREVIADTLEQVSESADSAAEFTGAALEMSERITRFNDPNWLDRAKLKIAEIFGKVHPLPKLLAELLPVVAKADPVTQKIGGWLERGFERVSAIAKPVANAIRPPEPPDRARFA